MYTRDEMIRFLEREFETEPGLYTSNAVDYFFADVLAGKYELAVMLDDIHIEGDLETDAEHVYDVQGYWDQADTTFVQEPIGRGIEDHELPYEDKLIKEDEEL